MTDNQSSVEYRDIPGFLGYRAGNDGSIWSCWTFGCKPRMTNAWHKLKAAADNSTGYPRVTMKGKTYIHVHRLVLLAFVGPCPPGMECCHADGDRTNNVLGNLRWDTSFNNHVDRKHHGNAAKVLSPKQVIEIAESLKKGKSARRLAEQYDVGYEVVGNIRTGHTWSWLTGANRTNPIAPLTPRPAKLTRGDVEEMRRRALGGESPKVLAAHYGVCPRYVRSIRSGERRITDTIR